MALPEPHPVLTVRPVWSGAVEKLNMLGNLVRESGSESPALRYTPETVGRCLPAPYWILGQQHMPHSLQCSPRTEFSRLMRYLEALRV